MTFYSLLRGVRNPSLRGGGTGASRWSAPHALLAGGPGYKSCGCAAFRPPEPDGARFAGFEPVTVTTDEPTDTAAREQRPTGKNFRGRTFCHLEVSLLGKTLSSS